MNIKMLVVAFQPTYKALTLSTTQDKDSAVRSLVGRFAAGNINLQLGHFLSQRDIDAMREKVCKYNFAD